MKLFAIFASFASVGVPKSLSGYLLHFLSKQRRKPMLYKCCSAQLLNNSLDLFYILYLNTVICICTRKCWCKHKFHCACISPSEAEAFAVSMFVSWCFVSKCYYQDAKKSVLVSVRSRGRGQHNMIQYNTIQVRGRGQYNVIQYNTIRYKSEAEANTM